MRKTIGLYTLHIKYWGIIVTMITVFGLSLGYVGTRQIANLPRLTLSTAAAQAKMQSHINGIQDQVTNLDTRLTTIEHKVDRSVVRTGK